ncbi:restriction endonuclease [Streptomyces sp. 6N223]|uniref:restriction endonuclease n=1 Tax=Streptomyces sp. 6N223 TaxID=3457412 RepID=UPI003FD066F8
MEIFNLRFFQLHRLIAFLQNASNEGVKAYTMTTEAGLTRILQIAREKGFETDETASGARIRIPCSPISMQMDIVDDQTIFAAFYLRTTSWEWPGERSDLHDAFSVIAASHLAEKGIASCALLDVPHPAARTAEAEIYARFMAIGQPNGGYFHSSDGDFAGLREIIEQFYWTEYFLHSVFPMHPEESSLESQDDEELIPWVESVTRSLGKSVDPVEDTYGSRGAPAWFYYRCASEDISIFQGAEISDAFDMAIRKASRQQLSGVTGDVKLRGSLRNYLPAHTVSRMTELLDALAREEADTTPPVIALENCLVTARSEIVIIAGAQTGYRKFDEERARILRRHQDEASFLFPVQKFVWAPKIDGGRFQDLVHDLLVREPGVETVRAVGSANEPDGGRDHIAEWFTPIQDNGVTEENAARLTRKRRVIIQCKASAKSVGKSKIPDVRDIIEHHDAQGYLLAASNEVGVTASDFLIRLRERGDYFTDWWGRNEIEDRLRRNPDIAGRYRDIVTADSD